MRLRHDDELYRVDNEYLGPPGSDWPRARYIAYVVWACTVVAMLGIERQVGLGLSGISVLYTLAGSIAFTRWIGRYITHEVPAREVARMAVNDLRAPRELHYEHDVVLVPGRVRYREVTPRRHRRG